MSWGTSNLYIPAAILMVLTVALTAIFSQAGVTGEIFDPDVVSVSPPSGLVDIPGFAADTAGSLAAITAGMIEAWINILGAAGWAAPLIAPIPFLTAILTVIIVIDLFTPVADAIGGLIPFT